ncbi:hypothetical protein N7528_002891 [Penicillium herquei]|nr:hypothetical protein N7528_002891 [Penicillium herquei]
MPYLKNNDTSLLAAENDINAFEKLVHDLSAALGPSSGLDSEDVDSMNIQLLMEKYVSNSDEWSSYALGDASRSYTRNLIDEGNGKSNLLILVWSPGKGSAIHDHANAHCVMKILKGRLQETLYSWPDKERLEHGEISPPQVTRQTIYEENQVTYMSDKTLKASPSLCIFTHHRTQPKKGSVFLTRKLGKQNISSKVTSIRFVESALTGDKTEGWLLASILTFECL